MNRWSYSLLGFSSLFLLLFKSCFTALPSAADPNMLSQCSLFAELFPSAAWQGGSDRPPPFAELNRFLPSQITRIVAQPTAQVLAEVLAQVSVLGIVSLPESHFPVQAESLLSALETALNQTVSHETVTTGFSTVPQFASASIADLRIDVLPMSNGWQQAVEHQVAASQNQQYQSCLFGDSISSGLGDSLGDQTFNFALGGMSTVSLVEQLRQLSANHVQCQTVMIAIGTNDAMYTISNDRFTQNLKTAIDLVRSLQPDRIILLPAFYSTVAASLQPNMAGPISRVDEINQLIQQVATDENLPLAANGIQSLFDGEALKDELTVDGVHLNDAGLNIYRQALLDILNSAPN